MSRLIDADSVIEQGRYAHLIYADGSENLGYTFVVFGSVIKHAPTVDAVEVVRCKDCKHSDNMPLGLCYLHYEHDGDPVACVEPDDFCSYGERK